MNKIGEKISGFFQKFAECSLLRDFHGIVLELREMLIPNSCQKSVNFPGVSRQCLKFYTNSAKSDRKEIRDRQPRFGIVSFLSVRYQDRGRDALGPEIVAHPELAAASLRSLCRKSVNIPDF